RCRLMSPSTKAGRQGSVAGETPEKSFMLPGHGAYREIGGRKTPGRKMPGKSSSASLGKVPVLPAFIALFSMRCKKNGFCVGASTDVRRTARAIGLQFPGRSVHARAVGQRLPGARHARDGADGS